ncbi:M1 family metallopeptidase [Flavitalea flava]
MKIILLFSLTIALGAGAQTDPKAGLRAKPVAQQPYWQQEVHYVIRVALNDADHSLKGFETIEYVNHSPDTLTYLFFHLWPNAYKDSTTALYRQLTQIEERKDKLKKIKENGYIDRLAFTVNGTKIDTEEHPQHKDIIKLLLPFNLLPGEVITIATPFFVKIPSYFSRLGHEGQSYMISQWYPKPAVYDRKGWHEMPYLDQGEFYSEFGTFDVQITLPAAYTVGATGQEQHPAGSAGVAGHAHHDRHALKTLDYHAENVHDFAWFADKYLITDHDTLGLPSGKVIDVYSYYRHGINRKWQNSISYIKDAVRHYSDWIGEYPYPVVSTVEGPGNSSSGGMEYPMITLITSPGAGKSELDGVIAHEVGHNWFYGALGSNEREHPWMDEGLNTFYEFRYEAEKYRFNMMMGSMIPEEIRKLDTEDFLDAVYKVLNRLKATQPVETPATGFSSETEYGLVIYARTAVWVHLLERTMGSSAFEKGMKDYYREWKGKHPYPEDLKASLENSSHLNLDQQFELLNQTGSFPNLYKDDHKTR